MKQATTRPCAAGDHQEAGVARRFVRSPRAGILSRSGASRWPRLGATAVPFRWPPGGAVLLTLLLVACASSAPATPTPDTQVRGTVAALEQTVAALSPPATVAPARPTAPPPSPTVLVQLPIRIALAPQGNDRANGSVQIRVGANPNQTVVEVAVKDLAPNSEHINHVHTGSCEREGAVTYPLSQLKADGQGAASATTTIDKPVTEVANGRTYLNVHAGPTLPSPGVACGNIPALGSPGR